MTEVGNILLFCDGRLGQVLTKEELFILFDMNIHVIATFLVPVAVSCCPSVLSALSLLPSLFIDSSYPSLGNKAL